MRISQKIQERNLAAARERAAAEQKKAQEEYDAYIKSPEGQQYLKYEAYQKQLAVAKQAQAELKQNLLASGYTSEERDGIITLSAPSQTVKKTRRGEVIDSTTYSPAIFTFQGNTLVSQANFTGYTYNDATHVALTFSKTLEDKDKFLYREKSYDIEGYSTDIRSDTVVDIIGNVYSKDMWLPKDYDNKYKPESPDYVGPQGITKPENYDKWNAEQKNAWLKSQNDKGKYTQEQLALSKSLTNQEQVKRYGRVITPTTNETKTTYSFINDKNQTQNITRKQYKDIEAKNKEIEKANSVLDLREPTTITQQTNNGQDIEGIFKPPTVYGGLGTVPAGAYDVKTTPTFLQKAEAAADKTKSFFNQTSAAKREQTINFIETSITRGVNNFITTYPGGKQVLQTVQQFQEGEIGAAGNINKENLNLELNYGNLAKKAEVIGYSVLMNVAQTPTFVLKALDFADKDTSNAERKAVLSKAAVDIGTGLVQEPLVTIGTAVGTYKTFQGINYLVTGKTPADIKAAKIKNAASQKVLLESETKGNVYYNGEKDLYLQIRRAKIQTGNKLDLATQYVTVSPKQTYTIAETSTINKGVKTPQSFSVTTPTGYQYTTTVQKPNAKTTYYIRSETSPKGITKTKVIEVINKGKLQGYESQLGKTTVTQEQSPVKFQEPNIKIKNKPTYISADDYRYDLKRKATSSKAVKTRDINTNVEGTLITKEKTNLYTTTVKPATTAKVKATLDISTGEKGLEPSYLEINPTKYKYTTQAIEKNPTVVTKQPDGTVLIEKEATSITRQVTQAETKFRINLNQNEKVVPKPKIKVQLQKELAKPTTEFKAAQEKAITTNTNQQAALEQPKTVTKTIQTKTTRTAKPKVTFYTPQQTETPTEIFYTNTPSLSAAQTKQENKIGVKTEIKQNFISISKQTPTQEIKQNPISLVKQNNIQNEITIQRQRQDTTQNQINIQRQENIQQQENIQKQEQLQENIQEQIQIQEQLQKQSNINFDTPLKIETPPPPPKIPPRFLTTKKDGGGGFFQVQVRRQGKFKVIATTSTEQEAFKIGRTNVQNTAAASFRVKGFNQEDGPINTNFMDRQFYSSKKEPGTFIQKNQFRISTAGEKREITAKGIMTNRLSNRKSRRGFLW